MLREAAARRSTRRRHTARGAPSTISLIEIACEGALTPDQRKEFCGWEVHRRAGQTRLIGRDVDQAALHGALDRLNSLGLRLVEVCGYPQIRL